MLVIHENTNWGFRSVRTNIGSCEDGVAGFNTKEVLDCHVESYGVATCLADNSLGKTSGTYNHDAGKFYVVEGNPGLGLSRTVGGLNAYHSYR